MMCLTWLHRLWLCCLLGIVSIGSHAADGLVAMPALNSAVTDLTQTLSAEEQTALNQKLTQFSQQAGSQIAILILPTTQPEEISQFGIRLAEAWKIGREKQDDGVIVIVAKQDRKMRIEVGYGLEGAVPDAVAKRIIAEQLTPAFKQGQFYQGLNLATDSLIRLIQGEQLPAPGRQEAAQAGGVMHWLPILMFVAIFAGAILRGMLGAFFGSAVTGGVLAVLAGWLGATLLVMGLVGLAAFIFTLAMGSGGQGGMPMGGFPGGYGGGRSGPDIFSGGGGGFGGGGASGDW
ncbi:YgcG family protein [Methylophilus aquaticus]|uniref:YgcG family protein n=2 Tax=Methylophilus aquaticus TaxID=1971610 RepID=A0ABT9JQD3_9PROT|nr:YgcG family protein [Methylophilus aquaticus]MDP8566778.1 YgcG family protein [Methylophilus aquaticus]